MREKLRLGIVIFGCDKIDKYKEELRALKNTWFKKTKEYPDIKAFFFLGEETTEEFSGDDYINLKGVADDKFSVNYKTYDGIKYIYDNYDCDFIYCCGTDTYVNIPKLYKIIDNFNPEEKLYIGGCGMSYCFCNSRIYFHSGGTGFILTREVLKVLVPLINNNIYENWDRLCRNCGIADASYLCDVSLGYYMRHFFTDIYTIDVEAKVFYCCSYNDLSDSEREKSIICHFMCPQDVYDYDKIMEDNNFFLHNTEKISIKVLPT